MTVEARKLAIIQWIAELTDAKTIKDLEALKKRSDQIIGYDVKDGHPVTAKALKKDLEASIEAMEKGDYISQEALRKKFNKS